MRQVQTKKVICFLMTDIRECRLSAPPSPSQRNDAAPPARVGAYFRFRTFRRRDVLGVAGRKLRRQRRRSGFGFGADDGIYLGELYERIVRRRHVRGRVLERQRLLRWQGCRALRELASAFGVKRTGGSGF